ncbi:MAG: ABC transporter permease, partial [Chloroflexi bacterium]|nr:ABC transporter permease [Chloroflexota bacterium]
MNAVPLILTGLAVGVAFRAGLFNIGAEGQLLMGAVVAAGLAPTLALPWFLTLPLLMLLGGLAGALWAFVPGLLKARLGANEVITSLMMSYIAFYVTEYLVVNPLKAEGVLPATELVPEANRLPRVGDFLSGVGQNLGLSPEAIPSDFLGRLHLGLPIALLVALGTSYLLWRTVPGFAIRILGLNPEAATYGGLRVGRAIVLTMMLSGAIAGLAGAIQVLGVNYRMSSSFSPGFGFTGIAVALLGNVTPVGIVLAAVLFGVLQTGGQVMQRTAEIPVAIVTIIQALVIFFVAVQVPLPRAYLYAWGSRLRARATRWRS